VPIVAGVRTGGLRSSRGELIVRDGNGGKHRVTMLPASLKEPLRNDLMRVKEQHEKDVAAGRGAVALPSALRTKYPNAFVCDAPEIGRASCKERENNAG